MKTTMNNMKTMIKDLFFDRKLVRSIKKANVNKGHLYNQLMSGRITLKEYLQAA
ncbi:hypothetical protein OCK74_00620 [Chitinophagaceae bacterium LB-8]|uniref:Uncharacterized protein n=1 Tax=Paraflavisolibacter caeni TaxID=2982496 RepID=A0A9X2XN23_9BACT|nr:hypothetical protein [Paraflavisolibacter caeni]MCU7547589.1 hypothetical protein [Paraflavisolibacter caeni]